MELTAELGIRDKVSFLGRKDNVAEYLQCADILVMPSVSEGMSNALLEAMACGLAVIATNIAGNNEVVAHLRNGVLIEPRNARQLAEALLYVLGDAELASRLGQEARKTVEEGYSLDQVVDQYMELYQSLASDKQISL